jgi:arylsulfatase A
VNAPNLVPGGRVGSLIDFSDLFPTICELAGVRVPPGLTLDGRSYAKYLRGEGEVPREWIFNQYRPDRVVRDTRYKLWDSGKFYDLQADPDEQRPLEPGADAVADHARARLQAVLDSMPPDTPLPFPPRSLSAFRLRRAAMESRPH